jgi:hypothetical protein
MIVLSVLRSSTLDSYGKCMCTIAHIIAIDSYVRLCWYFVLGNLYSSLPSLDRLDGLDPSGKCVACASCAVRYWLT